MARSSRRVWILLLSLGVMSAISLRPGRAAPRPLRIVFLGDSITDGHVYPALVEQALVAAGRPVPRCINAGVASDTAAHMRKRFERDVLSHHPDLVTLSAGINDVLHHVNPADYERDVEAIAEQLHARKIPLILLTTTVLGSHMAEDRQLAEFNAALRRVARKYGCKVARVNELLSEARKSGKKVLERDHVHPNFEGHRLMAQAVLEALGYADVPVPKKLEVEPLPGLIRDWHLRTAPGDRMLTETGVAALKVDDSWKVYRLPEKDPVPGWWTDLARQQGFALSLERLVGRAGRYQGITTLEVKKPARVYFNTGAGLETIWLNGQRIYRSQGWTGWHPGKERVPASLRAGRNTIVIETYGAFFLSCTDTNDW